MSNQPKMAPCCVCRERLDRLRADVQKLRNEVEEHLAYFRSWGCDELSSIRAESNAAASSWAGALGEIDGLMEANEIKL